MFRADLHCHSTCSDGTMTPRELLLHAKDLGLSALCITDHDTTVAYESAIPIAKELGVLLGVGAEFSSLFKGVSVHILAYDFCLDSPAIIELCQRHERRRFERNKRILEKLKQHQMPILEEELPQDHKVVGRPHIASAMVKKGYVSSIQQAFDLYIGDGKLCYDVGEGVSTEETIECIHKAQGKAFIAHPHLIRNSGLLKELLNLSFDGIECYYGRFSEDVAARFVKMAKKKGLLVSGGSDFHGSIKEYIELGCSWIDEERFYLIFSEIETPRRKDPN